MSRSRIHIHPDGTEDEYVEQVENPPRCVRCGTFDTESWQCRDDHEHQWYPEDHWYNKKWREVEA